MLINDNHNWYLLIAKDEKPGTAARKRVGVMNITNTFAHICDYRVGVCFCLISVSVHTGHL